MRLQLRCSCVAFARCCGAGVQGLDQGQSFEELFLVHALVQWSARRAGSPVEVESRMGGRIPTVPPELVGRDVEPL